MSNHTAHDDADCPAMPSTGAVTRLIAPRTRDLGGFSVRRALPHATQRMVGPWIFFDHFGPAELPPGDGMNVRPHPHIHLATVTYLFEGEIVHRDSVGSHALIHPGDINLMVAGRGITHSERERPEAKAAPRRIHGLQLWHALPEAHEDTDPAFHHHPASTLPTVTLAGVPVRVMMGTAYGVTSPVETFAETLYIEAKLEPGQELTLPHAPERAVYVAEGEVTIGDSTVESATMAILAEGEEITVQATQPTRLALIGGEPLGKRYIEWNFISSRKERIEQAKRDWKEGRFPKTVGDEDEFIPLPE